MSFDLDQHFEALDAEMAGAVSRDVSAGRQVQKVETASEMMTSVVSTLHFLSKHCADTPGLDFLVGIRGGSAELRAERPQVLTILRFEQDGTAALKVEERQFASVESQTASRLTGSEAAVQQCIDFVARHIARIRPDLARDTAQTKPAMEGEKLRQSAVAHSQGLDRGTFRDRMRAVDAPWTFDRRAPRRK